MAEKLEQGESDRKESVGILKTGDIPKSLDHWQGRVAEITQLHQWLADDNIRLIGIEGIGGTGKSMLATKIYEKIEGFPKLFWADVSSGATIFSDLARRVLTSFGDTVPDDELKLVNALVQCLRSGQYLLIIDNLETLLDSDRNWKSQFYEEFFRTWLEHGKASKIIVTTRERPNLTGFEWLPLKGLKIEEGVSFLKELGIQGELSTFVELVDGHPLLLRLVAYLIKYEFPYDPSLNHLADLGLGNLRELLTDSQVVGVHRRETVGMALVLDASFNRLADWQKIWLHNLSVYRVAFDAEAATEMFPKSDELPVKRENVEQELRKLLKRSLLEEQLKPKRQFSFQSVVLEYLRYKAGDQTEAHKKAINYYDFSKAEEKSWKTIDDLKEYLEIFYHLYQLKEYDYAFDTIQTCDNFLTLRGYYTVKVELYEQLVTAWQHTDARNNWKFGTSLTYLSHAYNELGQYHQAIEFCQRSLEIYRSINGSKGEAISLYNLGIAYCAVGKYDQAIDLYQQSLKIERSISNLTESEELCDRTGEANLLMGLGSAYNYLGQYRKAIEFYQQSLQIQRSIGDSFGEGASLANLGQAYNNQGKYHKAIKFSRHSLEIFKSIGDRKREAISLGNLGTAYRSLRQYNKAIEFYEQSLEILRSIGARFGEGNGLGNLGNVYHALGQYNKAIEFYKQSLIIKREICDRFGEGASLMNLGSAYKNLRQYNKAIKLYQQSLYIAQEIGDLQGEDFVLTNLGSAYQVLGHYYKAIGIYQKSVEIKRTREKHSEEANSLICLSNAYYNCGRFWKGYTAGEQAQRIFDELNIPIETRPSSHWLHTVIKYAQKGKFQLFLCFIFGLIAFPFALVWIIIRFLWLLKKRLFGI